MSMQSLRSREEVSEKKTQKTSGSCIVDFLSWSTKMTTKLYYLSLEISGELMDIIRSIAGVHDQTKYDSNFLAMQGSILAERVKKSGIILVGQDLSSYNACLKGDCNSADLYRIRELLARIGR